MLGKPSSQRQHSGSPIPPGHSAPTFSIPGSNLPTSASALAAAAAAAANDVSESGVTSPDDQSGGGPAGGAYQLSPSDVNDILIIQDFMDTIEQIPTELTRVHSDLNELGAVLYSTLCNLERKLNQLINWVQDPTIRPEKRFQLLQEIAEEAARYKLGADDKIRVAGGACDGLMLHQRHISNLLQSSTLLDPSPPSPYSQSLTLQTVQPVISTRRGARTVNSPFTGGKTYSGGAPAATSTSSGGALGLEKGDTPTKKKKSRVQQLGKDDDDTSSVNGAAKEEKKRAPQKRKKQANRAVSPSESVASTSVYSKGTEPVARTARQIAAAAAKARAAARQDNSSDSDDGERKNKGLPMQISASNDSMGAPNAGANAGAGGTGEGLGLDLNSREGSAAGGKSGNNTPNVITKGGAAGGGGRVRAGVKRNRGDNEDEEDGDEDEDDEPRPLAKRNGKKNGNVNGNRNGGDVVAGGAGSGAGGAGAGSDGDGDGEDGGVNDGGDADTHVYCVCQQVGYGQMIGCDDDECEIEWYHVACVNLDSMPEGNWICPQCTERRKRNQSTKSKKPVKSGKRK